MTQCTKRPMIVGLTGKAGSGKSTAARIIANILNAKVYHLADPIKQTINPLFNWNEEHSNGELKDKIDLNYGFSPREAYQKFGTEFARALNENIWLMKAQELYEQEPNLVIADVRFDNEAAWIIEEGGIVIELDRPDTDDVAEHSSEAGISREYKSVIVINDSDDLNMLRSQLTYILAAFDYI